MATRESAIRISRVLCREKQHSSSSYTLDGRSAFKEVGHKEDDIQRMDLRREWGTCRDANGYPILRLSRSSNS